MNVGPGGEVRGKKSWAEFMDENGGAVFGLMKDGKVFEQWGLNSERMLLGHRGGRSDEEIAQMAKAGVVGFTVTPSGLVIGSGNFAPFGASKTMPTLALIEKSLSAIREDLVLIASVTDLKELADLLQQKVPIMKRNYAELTPYMTVDQRSRSTWLFTIEGVVEFYFQTGKNHVTDAVTRVIPRLIADLDDIAEILKTIGPSG